MRLKIGLTLLVLGIEAVLLVSFGLLVPTFGLSHDASFIVAVIGGILIGWPAGPVLAAVWLA